MDQSKFNDTLLLVDNSLTISDGRASVTDPARLRENVHRLVRASVMERGVQQGTSRYVVRLAAEALGVYPASINDLYMARGRGEVPANFTVPAMNLRALSFDAARAVFQAAKSMDAGAFIFEIARSEMGYTDQRPAEYVTNILAAAIAENYRGPVFIQGDHFQVSAKRYGSQRDTELQALRELVQEAIAAGFYNIDIDSSTLVDLTKTDLMEQQTVNAELSAMFTGLIRELEPEGVTISVGGEIGEVGGHNSTEPELRAYMDSYNRELERRIPGVVGLSKISIQTGTSHGGVVLPDGTIKEVSVDFDTLLQLSRIAREEYGMGGAVQHGASTLPETAFGKFVEAEAVEVHLATNFMNMLFDRIPDDLRSEMYAFLDEKHGSERKPDMTEGQFYYKTRKNALGPFKRQLWEMPENVMGEVREAWEKQFQRLFELLGMEGTRRYVDQTIHPVSVQPHLKFYLGDEVAEEDISDLAD